MLNHLYILEAFKATELYQILGLTANCTTHDFWHFSANLMATEWFSP